MRRANRMCGAVALLAAATVAVGARDLVFFSAGIPGPGLVPMLAAALMALCGVVLIATDGEREGTVSWPSPAVGLKLAASAGSIFLYTAVVPIAGTGVATSLFLGLLCRWWGAYRWRTAIVYGVLGSTAIVLVFDYLLGVQLPSGPWS